MCVRLLRSGRVSRFKWRRLGKINRAFGYRTLYVDPATEYAPGVFYCKDAFEGLDTVDKLTDEAGGRRFVEESKANLLGDHVREALLQLVTDLVHAWAEADRLDQH